ncbi:MAG: YggS family pyridoxal phosphate-dependent enzyme [Chlamydiales bacterium]
MSVLNNLTRLLEEIEQEAKRAGRDPGEISVVAVSKGCSVKAIEEAYWAGVRDFGENRVQEALSKMETTPSEIRWHFIGKLQKNKVNKVIGRFDLIHSVDTVELVEKIDQAGRERGVISSILLEANTSGEMTKSGLSPKEWEANFEDLLDLKAIEIHGLMTMAPLTEDESVIRHSFSALRLLRDRLQQIARDRADLSTLSMGMSHDFPIAIQEGATLLRIGTAIFSPR